MMWCSFLLPFLHVLTILFDWHNHDFLVREHEVNTFEFHCNLAIVTEILMYIAIDVLLSPKDGIVPGNEEQKPKANQPD